MYCLLACHKCKMYSKDSNHSISQRHSSTHCMLTACSIRTHPLTALRMQQEGWIDDAHHSGKLPAAIDV